MASFRFNFFEEDECDESTTQEIAEESHNEVESTSMASGTISTAAFNVLPTPTSKRAKEMADSSRKNAGCKRILIESGYSLWVHNLPSFQHVKSRATEAKAHIGSSSAVIDVALTRDVLSGVYEGGFKVWECALDLIRYMRAHESENLFVGRSVLEAGCGLALPSIYALQQGADSVFLQDLNQEVLESSTLITLALNAHVPNQLSKWLDQPLTVRESPVVNFLAGDWDALVSAAKTRSIFSATAEPGHVDIILTAETIYAQPQIDKLVRLIHSLLRRPGDQLEESDQYCPFALIAAKRYYFGTDGGTLSFSLALERMPRIQWSGAWIALASATVLQVEDRQSNIREVLKVFWKKVDIPVSH